MERSCTTIVINPILQLSSTSQILISLPNLTTWKQRIDPQNSPILHDEKEELTKMTIKEHESR